VIVRAVEEGKQSFHGDDNSPLERDLPPLSVRLPREIDWEIRDMPGRTKWLREVVSEAARRDLMYGYGNDSCNLVSR
jgi:hypothetical protein